MPKTEFDYYYGAESEQFSFVRVQRVLFTDKEHFDNLSNEAKLLYGLLLERMSLSRKNNWIDKHNRVYIIFPVEEIEESLDVGHEKALNLLKELDDQSGIGLVKKKRRGLGLPSILYVKKAETIIVVNVILSIMSVVIIAVMVYIRAKILAPFEKLSDIPYELSKGNLTAPVKAAKNRFFGRFVWGVDMLRENMEQQKERELNLQREKKMLLLSLSHDIKTPLSAIKLYSKALSKGLYTDKEKQLEIAESINAKADEIEGYVAEIITASREEFLSLDVTMGEFYLSELVTKIKLYYTEKLSLIKTDFFVGEYGDCLISGDLDRSVEVVQNIMENAIKYGDGKEISISFSEEEGCILIAVKNSGCTLPDTDLPHIFESFWRGANAENLKGSGLGLYICRQLMHKMNGEVFAQINDGDMCVTAVFGKTSCDRQF